MKKTTWNKVDWMVAKINRKQPFKFINASRNRYAVTQDEVSKQAKRK